jgi:hypothetical protein
MHPEFLTIISTMEAKLKNSASQEAIMVPLHFKFKIVRSLVYTKMNLLIFHSSDNLNENGSKNRITLYSSDCDGWLPQESRRLRPSSKSCLTVDSSTFIVTVFHFWRTQRFNKISANWKTDWAPSQCRVWTLMKWYVRDWRVFDDSNVPQVSSLFQTRTLFIQPHD